MPEQKPKSRPSRAIRDRGPCSRRPMRVEISKNIRWQSVVFPKFFDAYRCGGDCKFPLDKKVSSLYSLKACLQGGRVPLARGLTLTGKLKRARVYKGNFTGRVNLQPGTT